MLVLAVVLVVFIILRDLLQRTPPPGRDAPKRGSLADPQDINRAGHGASQVHFKGAVRPPQGVIPAKQEKASSVHATGPSTSSEAQSRGRPRASAPSASKPSTASGVANASPATVAPTVSLASLGPSFVKKFAELKVNTTHPRPSTPARASHASPKTRSAVRGRTSSLSPLSTPPRSPTPSPSPSSSRTPVGSRGRLHFGQSAVDFSLYKKKTRAFTKSPQKPQIKAAGKLHAEVVAEVTTVTTWFYKLSANPELLVVPPDLVGHPEGLSLGDIYFDRAGGAYQLWLWCSDEVDVPHWRKIPFGHQRDDGKCLIVTRKHHLLSWVTPSYYKQIASSDGSSIGEAEE